MPELPEVETTKNGIAPHIQNQTLSELVVRQPKLRWPIPNDLNKTIKGLHVRDVRRRAKYLLIDFESKAQVFKGTLIIHLGMSGSLRVLQERAPAPQLIPKDGGTVVVGLVGVPRERVAPGGACTGQVQLPEERPVQAFVASVQKPHPGRVHALPPAPQVVAVVGADQVEP